MCERRRLRGPPGGGADSHAAHDGTPAGPLRGRAGTREGGRFHGGPRHEWTVLLPHIASGTVETRNAMGQLVFDNIINYFEGKSLISEVN